MVSNVGGVDLPRVRDGDAVARTGEVKPVPVLKRHRKEGQRHQGMKRRRVRRSRGLRTLRIMGAPARSRPRQGTPGRARRTHGSRGHGSAHVTPGQCPRSSGGRVGCAACQCCRGGLTYI